MRSATLVLFLLVASTPLRAQTAEDLGRRYPVVTSYKVIFPGIFMTPKYTADGQVCEMSVQKQNVTERRFQDSYIPNKQLKMLLDTLVPMSDRGKPLDGQDLVLGTGTVVTSTTVYENVSITIAESINNPRPGPSAILIKWRKRSCDEPHPLDPQQPKH